MINEFSIFKILLFENYIQPKKNYNKFILICSIYFININELNFNFNNFFFMYSPLLKIENSQKMKLYK